MHEQFMWELVTSVMRDYLLLKGSFLCPLEEVKQHAVSSDLSVLYLFTRELSFSLLPSINLFIQN